MSAAFGPRATRPENAWSRAWHPPPCANKPPPPSNTRLLSTPSLPVPPNTAPNRLVDQWQLAKNSTTPAPIPSQLCAGFPSLFCSPSELAPLGFQAPNGAGRNCTLARWLAPAACILPVPEQVAEPLVSEWERQSAPLRVSDESRRAFEDFLPYFQGEVADLGDTSLDQEVDLVKKLIATQA